MTDGAAAAQRQRTERICTLLGPEVLSKREIDGFVISLREIVEHFRIEWTIRPYEDDGFQRTSGAGFVLELTGAHQPSEHRARQGCLHCANLLLALRLVGDWLFPPKGNCGFCEVRVQSTFVRCEEPNQRACSLTRTLGFVSDAGTECRMGACHLWCMNEIKERLNVLRALERNEPRQEET